jgi:Nucleotide modification associated domain 2
MTALFSYVVDHDEGFAPHPTGRYCTLAWCKYKKESRRNRNIVELAKEGDWVVGTGGASGKSAGRGKLIYAMRVDKKLPLVEYCTDKRFASRFDAVPDQDRKDRYALVSRHFFYFGAAAVPIPARFRNYPLEKRGRGFRRKFDLDFISAFVAWLEDGFPVGMNGQPCKPDPDFPMSKCRPKRLQRECAR